MLKNRKKTNKVTAPSVLDDVPVEPRQPRRKINWRRISVGLLVALGLSLWLWISYQLAPYAVAFVFTLFASSADILSSPPLLALYYLATYAAQLALLIMVPWGLWRLWRRRREPKHQRNAHNPFRPTRQWLGLQGCLKWSDLGLAPLAFVVCIVVSAVLLAIFANFTWFDADAEQNLGFDTYLMGWDLIAAFVAIVIIPPICEELAYRGWLYGKIRRRLGFVATAVITSALFGLAHGQWNAAVIAFVLGFLACGLREITGNLYAGILFHMIKNGAAFWLLYVLHLG